MDGGLEVVFCVARAISVMQDYVAYLNRGQVFNVTPMTFEHVVDNS